MEQRRWIYLMLSTCLFASSNGFDFRRILQENPLDKVLEIPLSLARKVGDQKIHLPVAGGVDLSILKIEDTIKNDNVLPNGASVQPSNVGDIDLPVATEIPSFTTIASTLPHAKTILDHDVVSSQSGYLADITDPLKEVQQSSLQSAIIEQVQAGKMPSQTQINEFLSDANNQPAILDALKQFAASPNAEEYTRKLTNNEQLVGAIKQLRDLNLPNTKKGQEANTLPQETSILHGDQSSYLSNVDTVVSDNLKGIETPTTDEQQKLLEEEVTKKLSTERAMNQVKNVANHDENEQLTKLLADKISDLKNQAPTSDDMIKTIEETIIKKQVDTPSDAHELADATETYTPPGIPDETTGATVPETRKKRSYYYDYSFPESKFYAPRIPSTIVFNHHPVLEDVNQDLSSLVERAESPSKPYVNQDDSWRHFRKLQRNRETSKNLSEMLRMLRNTRH